MNGFRRQRHSAVLVLVLSASTTLIWAANGIAWAPAQPIRPALRDEFSLNGIWDFTPSGGAQTTIAVPEFWDAQPGFTCTQAVYQHQAIVPSSWTGKRIFLEFEGINHVATVSVNGTQLGQHIGGWVPFRYDITSLATAASTITVRVAVQAGTAPPTLGSDGKPLWPLGWNGKNMGWGIIHPVWLRAYGTVAIDDAFIQPSFRQKTLVVDYIIANRDNISRTVNLSATVQDSAGTATLLTVPDQAVTLAAGTKDTVRISVPWANPVLWFPDQPTMLRLSSRLK
jgi:beta-galactosidase/beta-glucuronidase